MSASQHMLSQDQPQRGDFVPLSQDPTKQDTAPYATSTSTGASVGNGSSATRSRTTGVTGAGTGTSTGTGTGAGISAQAQARYQDQVKPTLVHGKNQVQEFLAKHDLNPRNQFVMHGAYSLVVAFFFLVAPSLLLKYNPFIALVRGVFGITHKEGSKWFYVFLMTGLGASSLTFAHVFWDRGGKNSLEVVIIARLALAAVALVFTFILRTGSDALFLVGLGELVAALALKQTAGIPTEALVQEGTERAQVVTEAIERQKQRT